MNAKQLYDKLSLIHANHYFKSYEEFEVDCNNAEYPCILVIPMPTKKIDMKADRFNMVEAIVVMYLQKMEVDFKTIDEYDIILESENIVLSGIFPFIDQIKAIENISELCKFSDVLSAGAFAIEMKNNPICN